jgi:hypothetical protein
MRNVELVSLKPKIGASTFAYCLARELRYDILIDARDDSGCLVAAGLTETNWPLILSSTETHSESVDSEQLLSSLPDVLGLKLASGRGTPAEIDYFVSYWNENYRTVSLQGNSSSSIKIFCIDFHSEFDEQLLKLRTMTEGLEYFGVVVRTKSFNNSRIKLNFLSSAIPVFEYHFQLAARYCLQNDFGIPYSSSMWRSAKSLSNWLDDLWTVA